MTKGDKKLLLKDLSARLSYGVICNTSKGNGHLCSINQTIFGVEYGINIKATERDYFDNEEIIKPYLIPISSMTDEQKKEFDQLIELELKAINDEIDPMQATIFEVDFYNKHHLDWRGLITKGLAIDATGLNIY